MADTNTTPDQGDERRAIHEWLMREHKIEVLGNPEDDTAAVISLGTLRNIARVVMSAAQPVAQEASAFLEVPDVQDESGINTHYSRELVLQCIESALEHRALAAPPPSQGAPIDMVLHCPACGMQHIDAPEELPMPMPGSAFEGSAGWTNPPHRSHLCHGCGHIWRPADVPTNGVAAVKTKGEADSQPVSAEAGKGEPDPQLCSFYQVSTFPELVAAMEHHIEKLQSKLPSFSCYLQRDHGKAPCDHDCGKLRCMYPSEPVAVRGEVSERVAKCSAILTLIDNYAPEKLGTAERTHLAVAVDAVLALAGGQK